MFSTPWFGPTFYSRTYFPRPVIAIRDAVFDQFIDVSGVDRFAPVEVAALAMTVDAPARTLTVDAVDFIVVETPDRFVLVDG